METTNGNAQLTIVEIKKQLQRTISHYARLIDKNDQTLRYNNGETKWLPSKKGLCNWLKVSTDAKRQVMVWTISGTDYMKAEVRKLAEDIEKTIKSEFNQSVKIEIKNAPEFTVTSTGKSVSIYRGEIVGPESADGCPF